MAAACTGVEVEAGGARGQSLAWTAAKAAMRRVFDTGIGNERKP